MATREVVKASIAFHEGTLSFLSKASVKPAAHWMVLRGQQLYSYVSEDDQREPNHVFDLRYYGSVSSKGWQSKCFQLQSRTGTKTLTFRARSIAEKKEWISCIRKVVDAYGKTVQLDNRIETAVSYFLIFTSIAMAIFFAASTSRKRTDDPTDDPTDVPTDVPTDDPTDAPTDDPWLHAFCIPFSLYELAIIVLCTYYLTQFKWTSIKLLIKFNKFWIQSFFCSVFNLLSFVLLVYGLAKDSESDRWYFANSAVYFFGVFSIPLPAICIRLHHLFKPNENESPSAMASIVTPSDNGTSNHTQKAKHNVDEAEEERDAIASWLSDMDLLKYYPKFQAENIETLKQVEKLKEHHLKAMGISIGDRITMMDMISRLNGVGVARSFVDRASVSASISASKPIFGDNISKGAICLCYLIHFVSYIGEPSINHESYTDMLGIMYPHYDAKNWLYRFNTTCLRTFVGMSLTSVFFTFITELTDKQIISTNYWILWDLFAKTKRKAVWIVIAVVCILCIPFEVPIFLVPDESSFKTITNKVINIIWMAVNVSNTIMCCVIYQTLSGIYSKTRQIYKTFFVEQSSPVSPIRAFVLESVVLISLFMTYIVFMLVGAVQDKSQPHIYGIVRQFCILILAIFQCLTLIRVKQTQKFGSYYLPRFAKRSEYLLQIYYKCNCAILMYNVVYIYIFKFGYFGATSEGEKKLYQLAYAFSFSVASALLFLLSHFLASYEQWIHDIIVSDEDEEGPGELILATSLSRKFTNDALNRYMRQQRASAAAASLDNTSLFSLPLLQVEPTLLDVEQSQ